MIHSFLLMGQSNMAGRGFISDVKQIYDEEIKMLRNGRWQTMWEPINPDRPSSGIGLAASFAASWRMDHPNGQIGLIPCADGGSSLEDWSVDGVLFNHAVLQGRLAQQQSTIAGILWHQGENDCSADLAANYGTRLSLIIDALRRELQIPEVPLIIGGLGDYLPNGRYGDFFKAYSLVNAALQQFAASNADCYYVTASDLTANPDGLHFDASSQRKFGVRYYKAFQGRTNIEQSSADETALLHNIDNRSLTKAEKLTLLEYQFAFGELSLAQLAALQKEIKDAPEN